MFIFSFLWGFKARTGGHGCLVSTSFHMDLNDADHPHSWPSQPAELSASWKYAKPFVCAPASCYSWIIKKQVHFVVLVIFLPAISITQGIAMQRKTTSCKTSTTSGKGPVFLEQFAPWGHCQHHHPSSSLYSWAPRLSPNPFPFPSHPPHLHWLYKFFSFAVPPTGKEGSPDQASLLCSSTETWKREKAGTWQSQNGILWAR